MSPGRTSSRGRPSDCTQPQPAVMMIGIWPSGCVCQVVRAPGLKVTVAPPARTAEWRIHTTAP
jgi:hypothetical protein